MYSVKQVSALLGVHSQTVLHWIRDKKLRAIKLGHRTIRIRKEELEEFIRGRT